MTARRLLAVAVLLGAAAAHAGQEWKEEAAWKDFLRHEVKTLTPLLRSAVREDYRRQAWYLADRVLAADPGDAEARKVLDQWTDEQLQEGQEPKAGWLQKRDKALEELGTAWFHYGETLNAAKVPPEDYYEVNVRAHSYGSRSSTLLAAIEEAGHVWCHTFGDPLRDEFEKVLGPHLRLADVSFPPEFDDDYLRVRVRWPAAKVAGWAHWRLYTDLKAEEAARMLGALASLEEHFRRTLGSSLKKSAEPTDLLLFVEEKDYDRVGERLVPEESRKDWAGTSAFEMPWNRQVLVLWRDRRNGWIGDDAPLFGAVVPEVARRHLGADVRGTARGRGAWLLDGLAGAYQGLARPEKGAAEIEPDRCWLLAAARALREEKALAPWEEFVALDREKAKAVEKRDVKVRFRGAAYDARGVDVVAAQATALVVGLMKADGGRGAKKVGALVEDLFKRDSLPDLDKAMGWKKGRAFEEAEKAIEAAHGR